MSPSSAVQFAQLGPRPRLSLHEEIANLYNSGRDALSERYGRLKTLDAAKPEPGPSAKTPRLEEPKAGRGRYLLIEVQGRYFVAPRPDIAFNDADYKDNAMGLVFDCKNYSARHEYYNITLVEPAELRREGSSFVLEKPGQIQLGDARRDEL